MKHKQIRSWLQHFPRWKLLQTKRVFPVSVIFMFLICYYTLPKVLVADCCQIYQIFDLAQLSHSYGWVHVLTGAFGSCHIWKTSDKIQTSLSIKVILNRKCKANKSNIFTLMGRREGARTSCISEIPSCSWMLPLPLMSPEACAKPNHDSKFIKVREKKKYDLDLQGIGYFNAGKNCLFFVFPVGEASVSLWC